MSVGDRSSGADVRHWTVDHATLGLVDRRCRPAILDNVGGKAVVNFKQVWSKELGYLEIDVNEEGFIPATTTAQFVRVVGTAPADQMARVSKGVNTLWKNSPNLLAVRSEVAVTQIEGQDSTAIEATAETLPALIARELEADPAMKQMWEEFTLP